MAKKVITQREARDRDDFKRALGRYRGNITKACREVGISRQTGYAWIRKWDLDDLIDNLKDLGDFEEEEE